MERAAALDGSQTYCEQGFTGAADGDLLVTKAFVLARLSDSSMRETPEAVLGEAGARFGGDQAVQWYRAYSFRDGEHWSGRAGRRWYREANLARC